MTDESVRWWGGEFITTLYSQSSGQWGDSFIFYGPTPADYPNNKQSANYYILVRWYIFSTPLYLLCYKICHRAISILYDMIVYPKNKEKRKRAESRDWLD